MEEDRRDPIDADALAVDGEAPPSSRVALSRERIVETSIEFIDEWGLPGLTMRKLGERLGVEAMALYRYLPSREELLDAVVRHLVEEVDADEDVIDVPTHGWQDFLQRLAHGIRRVALRHPKAFPLIASRPLEAPWLRPPLRSLDWVQKFLAGLGAEGFSDEDAVGAYRAFTSFLLGHLLLEVAQYGADVGPLDVLEEDDEPDALAAFPDVQRLRSELSADRAGVEFEESLEGLLHRIAAFHSEHR